MGEFVADQYVPLVQTQLNLRFAPGDGIAEMIALQKEFKVFSKDHSLASSFALLNVAPPEEKDRRGWRRFLNHLKKVGSDVAGVNGHDHIVASIKKDLESAKPLPIFFTWHPAGKPPKVMVTEDQPFSFSATRYLSISVPTAPGSKVRKLRAS